MKNIFSISLFCILLCIIYSCKNYETDFRDFLGGRELVYTGAVGKVSDMAGNLRVGLKWKASTDPAITKYVVYWNSKLDSQVVNVEGKPDSIRAVINGLQEYVYSFTIHSFDAKGNKSIPSEINNIKVYGPIYQATLLNRAYNATAPFRSYTSQSVVLSFNAPDTVNINTQVRYENRSGVMVEKLLKPNVDTLQLTDLKLGTEIRYRSSYIPKKKSIDVFNVLDYSVFPAYVFRDVQCDKSLFREARLSNDAGTYEPGTSVSKLWDGSVGPQGYPNIFHSDGSSGIPQTITFDMGNLYANLSQAEETGRNCCHNPDNFEIWGRATLTDAATNLPANDAGWKDEAIAKGWVLLAEVTRTDDGQNAHKTNLISNPPPVRYIRVRIKHVTSGANSSNMSELTFWNRQ